MPLTLTLVPRDTREALGNESPNGISRSLYFDRFTDPELGKDDRRSHFTTGFKTHTSPVRLQAWQRLLDSGALKGEILYAQLQSRLLINMAGGVMENAGLALDRFGMPYIPGSAVKGCARRAALAALHEWCDTGLQPTGTDNLFTNASAGFTSPAQMLATLARVFGWCEQDWSSEKTKPSNSAEKPRWKSDFAWSCTPTPIESGQPAAASAPSAQSWEIIRRETTQILAQDFAIKVPESDPAPWKLLPNFAGSVSFLPGMLVEVAGLAHTTTTPTTGALELDVLTCHHRIYYSAKDSSAPRYATDDEEPNPVFFPSVAAGHVFALVTVGLRNCPTQGLSAAKSWLAAGLSVFGVGAKTAAGYGWFNCSPMLSKLVPGELRRRTLAEEQRKAAAAETEAERQREEMRRQKLAADREKLAGMTPDQRDDYQLSQLTDEQFRTALDNFQRKASNEQQAIVRALGLPKDSDASRRTFWEQLKSKAQRGGKPAQVEQAVRTLNKQMFTGAEGRMP